MELEKVVEVENISEEKQILLNKIIAAGLNSLSSVANYPGVEKDLLDSFVSRSFEQVLPCWPMLNEQIKFHIFKTHVVAFEEYMRGVVGGDI